MEIPNGLDSDESLTFVIGAVARAEADLLRALLETDLTMKEFATDPTERMQHPQRPTTDIRSGGLVLDRISALLQGPIYSQAITRGSETVTAVRRALKARNEIVHTMWAVSNDLYWADHVFNEDWSPRSLTNFVEAAEELKILVTRVDLLRGDIEAAHARARP